MFATHILGGPKLNPPWSIQYTIWYFCWYSSLGQRHFIQKLVKCNFWNCEAMKQFVGSRAVFAETLRWGAASIHRSQRICKTAWMSQFPGKITQKRSGVPSEPEENCEAASSARAHAPILNSNFLTELPSQYLNAKGNNLPGSKRISTLSSSNF